MSQGAPATDPLRMFLSGKRRHERIEVSLRVELGGVQHQIEARCVDLSEGGALVAIPQAAVEALQRRHEDSFSVIQREFCEGFDVRFLSKGLALEAMAVRLCIPAGGGDVVYLGCRFVELLSRKMRRRLGLTRPGSP